MKEKKKKSKIWIFFIIIIVLLVILFGGYMVYDKVINNQSNKKEENTTTEKKKEQEMKEDLNVDSKEVQDLIDGIKVSDISTDLTGYYYLQDRITRDTLDNQIKLIVGLQKSYNQDESITAISKTQMTTNIQSVFGKDMTYQDENIDAACYGTAANYNSQKQTYELVGGCGGVFIPYYHSKVVSATRTEDSIIIDEKAIYADFNTDSWDGESEVPMELYTPDQKTRIIETTDAAYSGHEDEFIDQYQDQLPTYRYTFKLEDGNYYFDSVEKVME